jgi:hypothetical protein
MRPRDAAFEAAACYWARYFAVMDELKREEGEILKRHQHETAALVAWSVVGAFAFMFAVYGVGKLLGVE